VYANGCECAAPAAGNVCPAGAIVTNTLAPGTSQQLTGVVPGTQAQVVYAVKWTSSGNTFHPKVVLATNSGANVVFDVTYDDCSTKTGCTNEATTSTTLTTWETNFTGTDSASAGGTSTWNNPGANATGQGGTGTVKPGTTVLYVKVRGTSSSSCSTFTLTVSNG
jgi:hypothetical protein